MERQPRPGGTVLGFGILGPLRVEVDGVELPLDSPKQRGLLGALLVEVGAVVPTDRLAEVLWASDQPDDPAATIHTHVCRLRSLLLRWGGAQARDELVTRPGGYALLVDPDRVDAGRFQRLVAEARQASAPQVAADLTGQALGLWRGSPLLGLDHEQAAVERAHLEELCGAALELRADALLSLGRVQEVVAELEAAVVRDPLRERLRGQLMVALYRSARQADALATYRDLRGRLVGELGVEPSPALRELERAVLQQAEHLPWPVPPAAGSAPVVLSARASRASSGERTRLPAEVTSFVGRQTDVRGVTAALRRNRVVVLTGTGGVGKSRLAGCVAREMAHGFSDGVVSCDLVSAQEARSVSDVVATTLGVLPSGRGSSDGVVDLLRARRLLLVLDNCEHVLDGASELADRIVSRCPEVRVLATSRHPLGVPGQQLWPVAPLDVADGGQGTAVELFCDRAATADPAFTGAGADREVVVELCRRLDGLPLAIELAAARTRLMTPADIAERLDRRFDVLTDAPGTTPARHRSLQAALDWSYELLPAGTQRLFDRLAVFAGGFSLDDAGRVCAGDGVPVGAVPGHVAELVDHSLVAVDRSGRHARYRLLESVRAYGEAHLAERGELPDRLRRHAEHCTSLAQRAAAGLRGPDEASWVQVVGTEFANFRAAHTWACASAQLDVALQLPAALCDDAYFRLRDEVYEWAERALALPGASAHPAGPGALLTAAVGRMQRGQLDRALEDGRQVLTTTADEHLRIRGVQLLAEIALYQGRLGDADRLGEEMLERARSVADPYAEALGHLYRVHAAAYGGRPADARAHLDAGWQVVGRVGTPSLRAGYSYLEGEVRLDAEPGAARAALREAIRITGPVRNRFLAGVARVAVASLEARHGRPDEAVTAFREIVDHWRACGDWVHLWTTLHNLPVLFERVGAEDAAAVLHGAVTTASTGARAYGADAERLARTARGLRRSLGEGGFAAADMRGRCMSDEEVVTFALDHLDHLLAERR